MFPTFNWSFKGRYVNMYVCIYECIYISVYIYVCVFTFMFSLIEKEREKENYFWSLNRKPHLNWEKFKSCGSNTKHLLLSDSISKL